MELRRADAGKKDDEKRIIIKGKMFGIRAEGALHIHTHWLARSGYLALAKGPLNFDSTHYNPTIFFNAAILLRQPNIFFPLEKGE